jgi:pyridoxal phosphate enzyme (YggS family)
VPVDIAANLTSIQQCLAAACQRAGRDPSTVTLMAVTKTHPPETVQAAADLGIVYVGENKIQEARAKIPQCPGRLRWHFIGHLQSNKAREAVELFEMIQSVDSLSLARELNKRCEQAGRHMPVLLEVNLAREASKFGYAPEQLLADLNDLNALPRLEIHGLMTVPPFKPVAEQVRPFFRAARELKQRCEDTLGAPLPQLSMGMSGDFEVAIEEGSTLVRIGTALFGERPKKPANQ